jgi:hypothetical protein
LVDPKNYRDDTGRIHCTVPDAAVSALGLPDADPANHNPKTSDYVLERVVKEVARDGSVATPPIDLNKRDCFVLGAKQS